MLALFTLAKAVQPDLPMPLSFWGAPLVLEFALGALLGLARAEGLRLGGWARGGLALIGFVLLTRAGEPDLSVRPLVYGIPALLLVAAAALGRAEPSQEREASRWQAALRLPVVLGDAS